MYDQFQGCTVDVQAATMIVNNPGANPALCTLLMFATTLCMMLVSCKEGFVECTVNVYAHAFNLNNQYTTLL